MKILINMILGVEMQALSEALVVGRRLGLPWNEMLDLITDSAAGAPLYTYKSKNLRSMDFHANSTVANQHKDMKMAMKLAEDAGAEVPASAETMRMYQSLMDRGMQDLDNIAVYLANEHLNGADPEYSN